MVSKQTVTIAVIAIVMLVVGIGIGYGVAGTRVTTNIMPTGAIIESAPQSCPMRRSSRKAVYRSRLSALTLL